MSIDTYDTSCPSDDIDDDVISKKRGTWSDFFELAENIDVPSDFMSDRNNEKPEERDLF